MMIVRGFEDINQKNVVHRDLKLANVFVHFKDLSLQDFLDSKHSKFNLDKFKMSSNLI